MSIIGLRGAINARNRAPREEMDGIVHQAVTELFGDISNEEFHAEWHESTPEDFTKRERVGDTAAELVQDWYVHRDPQRLYHHPKLFWDLLSNSIYQTSQTVVNGLRVLKGLGIDPMERDWGTVLDFGAGPGLSTVILGANMPTADLVYCDLNDQMARLMWWFWARMDPNGRRVPPRRLPVEELQAAAPYSMVVALESVEVFRRERDPVGVLTPWWDILHWLEVGGIVMEHTSWSAESRGYPTLSYYETYIVDGKEYRAREMKRPFRDAMKARGYTILGEGWNSSPTLWRKGE